MPDQRSPQTEYLRISFMMVFQLRFWSYLCHLADYPPQVLIPDSQILASFIYSWVVFTKQPVPVPLPRIFSPEVR